ncbi:MAG: type III-A CRISPR-associated protein Csm2 [Prevotellaceae bacterium]|jgi:CRISPR type III-A-associated protein Csm2|nr:type III-A CRISPR-associated protein Csm2 [Prevotellaceae bacterium]
MAYPNYSNNRGGGGGQNQNRSSQNQTFDQLAETVKNECFSTTYTELLKMSTTEKLNDVLKSVEKFVLDFGVKVSTSQLRNVYDKVAKTKSINELKLIRPQLAYIAGRATTDKDNIKKFLAFIDSLIKLVDSEEKRKEFKIFFESVVAYHKFNSVTN